MKAQKKLNVVLIVLLIILISVISFVGVYRLDKNQMVNIIPNYALGTDISGYRKVSLELSDLTASTGSETLTLEDDGEAESSSEEEENNVEKLNDIESLSPEERASKFRDAAKIIRKRLKKAKVEDFNVTCDEVTGKIDITLPENDQTDTILSDLAQKGKFEITDTNTGEVLLTGDDIKRVNVDKTEGIGYTLVYMDIVFKSKAAKKFEDITVEYNTNAVVEVNTTEEDVAENTVENIVEENAENTETTDGTNETSEEATTPETTAKKVDIKIDDSTLLSTNFSEVVDNGVLKLTLSTSSDADQIKNSLYGGYNVAGIIENDPLPFEYDITNNIYVGPTLETNDLLIIIAVLVAIAVVLSIILIVKFKLKGLLMTIVSVGYIAVLLLTIRYTNVIVSLEGLFTIELAYVMNYIFNYMLLSKLNVKDLSKSERVVQFKQAITKYSIAIIPVLILSVVACFTNWNTIYSFGMILFWSIVISLLYNLVVTNLLVRNK